MERFSGRRAIRQRSSLGDAPPLEARWQQWTTGAARRSGSPYRIRCRRRFSRMVARRQYTNRVAASQRRSRLSFNGPAMQPGASDSPGFSQHALPEAVQPNTITSPGYERQAIESGLAKSASGKSINLSSLHTMPVHDRHIHPDLLLRPGNTITPGRAHSSSKSVFASNFSAAQFSLRIRWISSGKPSEYAAWISSVTSTLQSSRLVRCCKTSAAMVWAGLTT